MVITAEVEERNAGVISMKAKFLLGGGALLCAAMIAMPAKAEERTQTVQALYDDCTSSNLVRQDFCNGVAHGVGTVMTMLSRDADKAQTAEDRQLILRYAACGYWTVGAAVQAFKNWAAKHPERWSDSGQVGVMIAIHETWPCK